MTLRHFSLADFSRTLVGKLTKIYLIVAFSILSITGVTTQVYLYFHAYDNALDTLKTRAAALADNLESPVSFRDSAFAQKLLDEMALYPDVVAAQVNLPDGQIFARYGERIDAAMLAALQQRTHLDWQHLGVVQSIRFDSGEMAQLTLLVSIERLNHDSLMMMGAGAVLAMLILLVSFLLFLKLSKAVSYPVETLAQVIREIETTRNYAMRAPILSEDEIGDLAYSFNAMIASLEHQNRNLDRELGERTRMQEKLDRLAHYDAVTHLPNRHFFHDRLAIALEQSQLFERSMAIVFVDLDNFKLINDSYGHHTGDLLLRAVAERLTGALRSVDIVSRLGGDEFAIIIESITDTAQLSPIAEKLIHYLTLPMNLDGNNIVISGSVGIAVFPEDADSADTLLRFADMAMYASKGSGKNTWRRYSASMSGHSAKRLTLESQLRTALQENQLELYYQPQVNLATGKIVGFEALARWHDPENGPVTPAQFIPVAEECGLIHPLGEWVLRTACAQALAWREAGLGPLRIAVNVSPRQFSQLDFATLVVDIIEKTHCPPELIELEITESTFMQYGGRCESSLALFHNMNLSIAIDDFGTGYSSMAHLKHLPVSKLKIDKSFIDDIVNDPADHAIVTAISSLARNLGLNLVAEGVEGEDQAAILQKLGCDTLQGYLVARPLPADQVPAFCETFCHRK